MEYYLINHDIFYFMHDNLNKPITFAEHTMRVNFTKRLLKKAIPHVSKIFWGFSKNFSSSS